MPRYPTQGGRARGRTRPPRVRETGVPSEAEWEYAARATTTRTADTYAMSFSFLSGRTFTEVLAGLAFTSIVSPGRNGFRTFFRALCAGFFMTLIFIRPGIVQAPTAPFWTWRSMTDSSASKTSATCRLVNAVFSAMSENRPDTPGGPGGGGVSRLPPLGAS